MENPTPVGKDKLVAIAVKRGSSSQAVLKWTIDNLLLEGHTVTLVHVRPKVQFFGQRLHQVAYQIDTFSGEDVRKGLEEGLKDLHNMRAEEMLLPFQSYCKRKNVQCEIAILEDNNTENALTDFVLDKNIDVLVMGGGSRSVLVKKLKGPGTASRVMKKIPYFCTVYVVSKGKLQFVKHSSSISESISGKEMDASGNENTSLIHCESSVTSRTRLLSDRGQDFEFRSPLKDYGYSDFRVGGLLESESDISFISPDKTVSDGNTNSWMTNSSDWSSSSFASHASSSTTNSDWSNWSSGFSQDPECHNLDELHKLQLELLKMKKEYASSRSEAPIESILASKLNMANQNEAQQMKTMNKPQRSLSRVEGRKYIQPTITTDLNQSIANEESSITGGHLGYRVYSTRKNEALSKSS